MGKRELKQIIEQLGRILVLLEVIAKPQSLVMRFVSGFATGAAIFGVLGSIEIIRSWIGG
jgi:hypothetical protein